ncbi:hypothetical protein [Paracoccus methylarcula]|uniref:Uncharacterized protein n=1 Tax=Paracoccus methylarcula TaxID=72022 RepID=A0A422R2K5_9RHOB|nr:hypothetical protein [Paracoccus methylarcula]RNF36421.1 hypothetical protein A7A09_002415 [Paracoccus methylarcula]
MIIRIAAILLAGGMIAGAAFASSDEAWEEFREQVRDSCAELAEAPEGGEVTIEVNPFGSESYGLAMVTVAYPGDAHDRMICVMDKAIGKAELSAPFTPLSTME